MRGPRYLLFSGGAFGLGEWSQGRWSGPGTPPPVRAARLKYVRVRLFELRLLSVALTVLWAAGGGIVLIAYRPGGQLDLLVGFTASLPLLLSVASIVWPPLVTSNRGSAGIFWLGLVAGLLLVPSIASVAAQVMASSSQPLLPSVELVYPWAAALFATALFAGLGVSRQLISETGIGRRRMAVSIGFGLAATALIGACFAGASLADDAALRDKPALYSRFGPTSARLTPPTCEDGLKIGTTATLSLHIQGNVDGRSIGTVDLTGSRAGSDVSWTAQVVHEDRFGQYGAIRLGSSGWRLDLGQPWQSASPSALDSDMVDVTVLAQALAPGDRATAEDRGLEYVEGARARHCRVAVDGPTFAASFPQVVWLTDNASMANWRGEIDYWVFGDGEVGLVQGSVNGNAQAMLPQGLQATVEVKLTATDRGQPVSITPPSGP